MAQVEIYRLRKSVPPPVREYSVFDFMEKGTNPDPAHYVKEWAGEMHGTLPLTIPGRLMLQTPEDYHGGELKNGDIAVVEGQPFYLDRLSGYKFVELDSFDTDNIRQAKHFQYGWFVDVRGAEAISDELAFICDDIGVPCGYLGEQSAGGIYNDRRPFLPGTSDENHLNFLYPEFLKGEEAQVFTRLLTELSETEQWHNIAVYLFERSPITIGDLEDARKQYAPELLIPAELRPLSKVIPADADKSELAYLTAKLGSMNEAQRNILYAVIEAEWHCGSITEIINLTENLEHFDLEPAFTESQYGEFRLENDWDICEAAIRRLEKSEDHSDRFLVKYITLLNRCADNEAYGYHAAKDDGGVFTKHGYISQGRGLDEKYHGVQDIPVEYRVDDKGENGLSRLTTIVNSLIKGGAADLSILNNPVIPELRDERLTFDEAHSDSDFGVYMPERVPNGFEFESAQRFINQEINGLFINWTAGYKYIDWRISIPTDYDREHIVSVKDREKYDMSLYTIPLVDSVPEELREYVDNPVFLADELTLDVVRARAYQVDDKGDTSGPRMRFSVMYDDLLISVSIKGVSADEVWNMLSGLTER